MKVVPKFKMTKTVLMHYEKLIFRAGLFIAALFMYLYKLIFKKEHVFENFAENPILLGLIWLVFVVEMILRFFPAKLESMGCQKQFARHYKSISDVEPKRIPQDTKSALVVALIWILLNGGIGVLYHIGIIDKGILLLIALFFSVCDVICILFFCPFQTWIMKNKCCVTCRIYNWDYAMMFTPLVFLQNAYAWSLFGLALLLLVKWEIVAFLHPERWDEQKNQCLSCGNCREKLCHHKVQLQGYLKKGKFNLKGNLLFRK